MRIEDGRVSFYHRAQQKHTFLREIQCTFPIDNLLKMCSKVVRTPTRANFAGQQLASSKPLAVESKVCFIL